MINRRRLINFTALLSSLSIIAGTFFLVQAEKEKLYHENQAHALDYLSAARARLEGVINATFLLTRGLVAHVATHPDIGAQDYNLLAKELLSLNPHIRNIALAKDNVITHMYPMEGNEAAIGLRYLDNPEQRDAVIRVMETKRTVVAGPVNLVQGGRGFINRTPIYLTTPGGGPGSGPYWGIVSMVIDADNLLEEAGLLSGRASGLKIALRGKDGLGERGALFFGDESVFRSDPVLMDVTLPDGSWQIAAVPEGGWNLLPGNAYWLIGLGAVLSLVTGLSLWMFGRLSEETFRRRVEEVAAEGSKRVKELAESLTEVVYRADTESFETTYVNRAIERVCGYTVEEWLGDPRLWEKTIHPDDRERVMKGAEEAGKTRRDYIHQYRIIRKDKSVRWVEDRLTWVKNSEGEVVSVNGVLYDITESKETEDALRRSESELKKSQNQLRAILDNSTTVIYLKDIDGRYLLINKQYERLFKITEDKIIGKTDRDIFPREAADKFRSNDLKIIGTKMPEEFEELVPQDDGTHTYISVKFPIFDPSGEIYGVCGISTDITARIRLEEEITRSQKLESVGLLAGGIAHDFNNMLAIVLNNISHIEKHGRLDEKVLKSLEETRDVALHARGLTQQLLTFSKGGEPIRQTTSISGLLKECTGLFLSGSRTRCDISVAEGLWLAEVDKGQMSQVFNNLILNADQAMPEGGVLEVEAANIELMPGSDLPLPQGRYLMISVRDHGIGIAAENMRKIFDPYFTTKEKGTGLGLTAVYSIVKKHGGHIDVDSVVGMGTTFTIYLPASDKAQVVEEKAVERHKGSKDCKILLMDDEERLAKVVKMLLKDFGCDADIAQDGEEAIGLYREALESGQPYSAVVMDLTIPGGMGGREAIKVLIEIDPQVKAIVTSGYFNDPVMANFKAYGFSGVIPKPYDVEELHEKLAEVMAG